MCEGDRPSAESFRRNMTVEIPLPRKIWLVARNTVRKIVRLQDCCGHPGEPGC